MKNGHLRTASLGGTALAAVMIGGVAHAQSQPPADDRDVVVITGSRVLENGNEAPTPLTVVSSDVLLAVAPQNIADGLNQLPAFKGSTSPQNTGSPAGGGGNRLNLRNFGANRLLILLDGRRHVPSTRDGVIDVDLLPQALIERVDIVTGGASAAYGSDAISGVVNFILDTDFTGLEIDAKAGISQRSDNFFGSLVVNYGADFADGRGHLLLSGEHYDSDGIAGFDSVEERDWQAARWMRIPVTGQSTPFAVVSGVNLASASYGGLISTTPTSNPLNGQTFNPDGTTRAFNFGTQRSTSYMIGGEDVKVDTSFIAPLRREVVFGRVSYDVSDTMSVFAEATWAEAATRYHQNVPRAAGATGFTIFRENAFLPTAVFNQMVSSNLTSFRLNRFSRDFGYVTNRGMDHVVRFVAGVEGQIGQWDYDVYYQRGENKRITRTENNPITLRLYEAADAVRAPNGQVVCRTTLTNPNNGCVPLNLFGEGRSSAAAIDYVMGETYYVQRYEQDVFAATMRGRLFDTWAGPVNIAFGGEYRKDAVAQEVDPIADTIVHFGAIRGGPTSLEGQVGGYQQTNPQNLAGDIKVTEGFAEVAVPLAKDQFWSQSLDLNAAVRQTDYSTSGSVTSWKIGLTDQIIDSLRLRATLSQDIRAASASELYAGSIESRVVVSDPVTGANGAVNVNTIGNDQLLPEEAETITAGFIYEPSFLPGFSTSFDYWKIDLQDAIQTLGAQVTLNQCAAGATQLCSNVVRDANRNIVTLNLPFLNVSSRVLSGYDYEFNYETGLGAFAPGDLNLRLLVTNFVSDILTVPGGSPVERAGDLMAGGPKWSANFNASYNNGPFSLILQERYIGKGVRARDDVAGSPTATAGNDIGDAWFTDLSARYIFDIGGERQLQLYGTINNLFDDDPPIVPSATSSGNSFRGTEFGLYDVVGRYLTLGAKVNF